MARVIDLRHQQVQEKEQPMAPTPVPEMSEPPKVPFVEPPGKIFTDSGPALPYPPRLAVFGEAGSTLRWIAPAAYRHGSTIAPYVLAALLGVGAILIGIFQRDVTTAVLFGFFGVMTVVHVRRPVPLVEIELSPLSIKVSDQTYRYEEIKSFWVHYEPEFGIRELSLHLEKWYQPYAKIQIEDQDPVQIRAILLEFIPEVEHEETLVHSLTRRLGL